MGSIWGRQDPGGPHVGPMNFFIWDSWYHVALPYPAHFNLRNINRHCIFITYQDWNDVKTRGRQGPVSVYTAYQILLLLMAWRLKLLSVNSKPRNNQLIAKPRNYQLIAKPRNHQLIANQEPSADSKTKELSVNSKTKEPSVDSKPGTISW